MVEGEHVAQPERQRQDPLAHGQITEDAVDQVRREYAHADETSWDEYQQLTVADGSSANLTLWPETTIRADVARDARWRRPIEALVRVANVGISAAIDPWGGIVDSIPMGEDRVQRASVAPSSQAVLYPWVGDVPMLGICTVVVLLVAGGVLPPPGLVMRKP